MLIITGHDYRRTFLHCILPVNVIMLLYNLHDTTMPIKVMLCKFRSQDECTRSRRYDDGIICAHLLAAPTHTKLLYY
jgi:hypothetical protein